MQGPGCQLKPSWAPASRAPAMPCLCSLQLSGQPLDLRSGLPQVALEVEPAVHHYYVGPRCGDRLLLYHGLLYFRARLMAGGQMLL